DTYNPFQNLTLSALIAAIPIISFLICLTLFKMKGIYAALLNLGITLFLVIYFFDLSPTHAFGSVIQGFVQGIWPIGYIIIMAVW
ncbi:L-lactate permease, partial [Escherichia coli]|nr:L-lactate permease [Escherichia coli]